MLERDPRPVVGEPQYPAQIALQRFNVGKSAESEKIFFSGAPFEYLLYKFVDDKPLPPLWMLLGIDVHQWATGKVPRGDLVLRPHRQDNVHPMLAHPLVKMAVIVLNIPKTA